MSISKEEALKRAKAALDRAQEKYDKAYAAWQDEIDYCNRLRGRVKVKLS